MINKYDVIIIGAGPAGLKCAEQFKNSNFSVLLIEKNKIIGPKTCGGGLTALTAEFDLPESRIKRFAAPTFYIEDKKYKTEFIKHLGSVDRYDLGQYLLARIKNVPNITILKKTITRQIKKDKIITNRGEFYYKYLIGADGSNSLVRRFLGLKSKIFIGLRYKIPQITNVFSFYFYPKLLGTGYLWIFSHKNNTNIGVYFSPENLSSKKAKEILDKFLEEKKFNYSNETLEAAPLNTLYKGCVFKNVFLIGDAAGLVSKITGEGISYALTSGEEIGKKILNPDYKMLKLKRILKIKKKQDILINITNRLPLFQKQLLIIFINLIRIKWLQSHFGI